MSGLESRSSSKGYADYRYLMQIEFNTFGNVAPIVKTGVLRYKREGCQQGTGEPQRTEGRSHDNRSTK